ncbi:MAG: uncharacterized protein QOF22_338 [Bradyrhizobium sp.]|jgi:uncharacterized protein YcgI (DUF1989 family)|nr:uncharacterized protein [Bradyrhizobium sp.]
MPAMHHPTPVPHTLSAGQTWLDVVRAGSVIGFKARGPGVGAAIFSWSHADPYEQLSDAYTFMELRRIQPAVGDQLYSTLRRPMLFLKRDDLGHSIDLLRHDYWWPRAKYVDALVGEAKANGIPAPLRRDWPYAVNIFARTRVGGDGDLIDDPVATMDGSHIEFIVKFDVVVAVMAAGVSSPAIEIYQT